MILIEHGDRPRSHDNLGYARADGPDWHLIAFDNWNSTAFCGQQTIGTVERHVAGRVCDVCSQLTGISHSEYEHNGP